MSGGTQAPRSGVRRPECSACFVVLAVDNESSVACISSVACVENHCWSHVILLSDHSARSASSNSVCQAVVESSTARGAKSTHHLRDVLPLDGRFLAGVVGGLLRSAPDRFPVVRACGISLSPSSSSSGDGSSGLDSTLNMSSGFFMGVVSRSRCSRSSNRCFTATTRHRERIGIFYNVAAILGPEMLEMMCIVPWLISVVVQHCF